jgi:hypothetical protein
MNEEAGHMGRPRDSGGHPRAADQRDEFAAAYVEHRGFSE